MNRIDKMFQGLRARGESALIPFVTTGDPDIETTEKLVLEMASRGADLIELGIPFSDPLADGPTIQAASHRALVSGTTPEDCLMLVARLRRRTGIPLVLMGYYNPVYQYGLDRFAEEAARAGVDGTIIPDLPLEEASTWCKAAKRHGLHNIFLVAPNTPDDRVKKMGEATGGFLYYVSVTGITGARQQLPPELEEGLARVRSLVPCPVGVGFGISRPEQVAMLSGVADGVIVGSAIVRIIEAHARDVDGRSVPGPGLIQAVGDFVHSLKEATRTMPRAREAASA